MVYSIKLNFRPARWGLINSRYSPRTSHPNFYNSVERTHKNNNNIEVGKISSRSISFPLCGMKSHLGKAEW